MPRPTMYLSDALNHALGYLLLILSLLIPTAYAQTVKAQAEVTGGIDYHIPDWFKESFLDINEDTEEADDEDKTVILFFHLNHCPYCAHMLEESFNQEPNRSFMQAHFDVIALNVKGAREIAFNQHESITESALSRALNVQYTPTLLFLDAQGKVAHRLNGYRNQTDFEKVLHYVKDHIKAQAYLSTPFHKYQAASAEKASVKYTPKPHPAIIDRRNLKGEKAPVALMFESPNCRDCERFHQRVLSDPEVTEEMRQLTFIRLNLADASPIVDFSGNSITVRQWADQLKLDYFPSIVLFDQGREVNRIDTPLFRFHLRAALRYIAERHYQNPAYPNYLDYMRAFQEALLKAGKSVNIGE